MNVQDWTVIVVEDTYDDIQLASAILTYHGVDVKVAINGIECLKLLEDINPTMIITDLSMPEMDGWEMLSQIRSNKLTSHIPVIAVTAYDSVDVAYDAANAGFDAYIPKPLSPRTFVDNLIEIIQ
jgi:CheY-like chemotaxis protein